MRIQERHIYDEVRYDYHEPVYFNQWSGRDVDLVAQLGQRNATACHWYLPDENG